MILRVWLLVLAGTLAWGAPRGCVGSVAVVSFRLSVQPPGSEPRWIPIRRTNNIPAGYRIGYQPLDLPPDMKKDAKLTLVAVPKATGGQVTVLEPRPAAGSTEWTAPFDLAIALVVFAPQGLDEKRLTNLVTRDEALVEQLAMYAENTAEVESGIEAVEALERMADEDDARPLASTPAEQALFALVRSLNPAVSSYNPLGLGRRAGPTSLSGKAAAGFFENAGDIFPGGGALGAVKGWLMPDTEFRAVFAQPTESDGMTLCQQWLQQRGRNKTAFLWAHRLINTNAPPMTMRRATHAALGQRAMVPVRLGTVSDWRLMDRIFSWRLVSAENGNIGIRAEVRPVPEARALEIDLRNVQASPGRYQLEGRWDWTVVKVGGDIHVHALKDWAGASVSPESEERLIAGSGPVMVDLLGEDLRFLERALLRRSGSYREVSLPLPPERSPLRLELDTDDLRAGQYVLTLVRVDGRTQELSLRVFDRSPSVSNLPVRLVSDGGEQRIVFTGSGLDLIERLESDRAEVRLGAGDSKQREAVVVLRPNARNGELIALNAKVQGRTRLLALAGALQVSGPRPKILEAKASLAQIANVALKQGELPAGSFASFTMKTQAGEGQPALTLGCADPSKTVEPQKLRIGEKRPAARLESAGTGALFLSLDPGSVGQSGCELIATLETEASGKSEPFKLGRVVRLPRIESLAWSDEKVAEGYSAMLRGEDLETIEKAGWDAAAGVVVQEPPRPVAGEGARQILKLALPWPSPSPKATLFIWLRGETEGRATKISP